MSELKQNMRVCRLVDLYDCEERHRLTFDLLNERDPKINISHRKMPSWADHTKFVDSKPYDAWYIIRDAWAKSVGTIYLTDRREVGLFIRKESIGKGYGRSAVSELERKHPGRLYANCNIKNIEGICFFYREGFNLLSLTLEKDA